MKIKKKKKKIKIDTERDSKEIGSVSVLNFQAKLIRQGS